MFQLGAGAGAKICPEPEPEPEKSKMTGSGNPGVYIVYTLPILFVNTTIGGSLSGIVWEQKLTR